MDCGQLANSRKQSGNFLTRRIGINERLKTNWSTIGCIKKKVLINALPFMGIGIKKSPRRMLDCCVSCRLP